MRHRRMFMQMAGLARTGLERRQLREQRKLQKAQADARQQMALVEKIMQREVGAPGVKPMPGRTEGHWAGSSGSGGTVLPAEVPEIDTGGNLLGREGR